LPRRRERTKIVGLPTFTHADDPALAPYRAVSDPDLAKSHGVFIAEGRLVVRRVLEDPRYGVRSLLLNQSAHRELEPLLARLDPSTPVFVIDTGDFEAITGINIHRGCLALVERPPLKSVEEVTSGASRVIVLDGVANADNVGGVFRNAAAFAADAVLLSHDSCDPLYRKAIRTSMAAVLRVPFARCGEWSSDLERMRAAGFTLVAFTPSETAEPLDTFAARAAGLKLALAFGAEGAGLPPALMAVADVSVRIPISAAVDSLNVAGAAGIALYRLCSRSG
jgi:tRNA G18 (ribose-2'-O)-methylase SpoU